MMPTSTVNKETAREIRDKHFKLWVDKKYGSIDEFIFAAMREIASLTWDACERHNNDKRHVQLPGREVAPDKETFLNNLF